MTTFKKVGKKIESGFTHACQKLSAARTAYLSCPTQTQGQLALFAFGVAILAVGLHTGSYAQGDGVQATLAEHTLQYNDIRIAEAVIGILTYIEGSFGALVMVGAGIAAILSSAFGQYRAALGCLVVAVGAFILRSVMSTFFNTQTIDGAGGAGGGGPAV